MTYALAPALQAALFQILAGDAALGALADGIHDALPPGTPAGTRVILGEDEALDRGDASGPGAEHRLTVSVITDAAGFLGAKQAAARITALLAGAAPPLAGGRVVAIWFQDARARRLSGGTLRRIDLRFRARIEIDAA